MTELSNAIMVDIDGTIAHMKDRSPFDWHRVAEDTVDETIVKLVKIYRANGYKIVIMSGRDSVAREDTQRWLRDNEIGYEALFMREKGDNRKDSIVKKELFERFVRDHYFVEFVLDDRNQVVDMWRNEIGLKVLQVAEGDF